MGGLLALSCASSSDPLGYSPNKPASSQQRATARREREARKKALAELTAKPDAGKAPDASAKAPPIPVLSPADAGVTDASDAAVSDATTDAGDAATDAGHAAPSADGLCDKLCGRVLVCAKEQMSQGPPGMGPSLVDEMVGKIATDCGEKCAEKIKDADAERLAKGRACLKAPDCDAFQTCMRELRDDD